MGLDNRIIAKQAKALAASKAYRNPVLTSEGYGSFQSQHDASEIAYSIAESLSKSANMRDERNAIPVLIEALYFYLRALANSTEDLPSNALKYRKLCKFLDELISRTRKHNLHALKTCLKWVVFNLKMQCLFSEADFLPKSPDEKSYGYVIGEIRTLRALYLSMGRGRLSVVGVEGLERGLKTRIHESSALSSLEM